jgi:hypothetical protein
VFAEEFRDYLSPLGFVGEQVIGSLGDYGSSSAHFSEESH